MGTPKLIKKQTLGTEFMNDDENEEIIKNLNRRGSNVSLSRFRSCPQLLDEEENLFNQTFESVADDTAKTNQIHRSRSPLILRRFQLDQTGASRSATPTPPSTPRSRHSFFSQRESSPTPNQGTSPSSTPKPLLRSHVLSSSSSRGSSFDSVDFQMNEENLKKHGILMNEKAKKKHSIHKEDQNVRSTSIESKSSPKVIDAQGHHHHEDELHHKCEMWLQTLNITQTDKIKSRSQMQLHPT